MICAETDAEFVIRVPRVVRDYVIQRQIANGSTCVVFEAADCNSGKLFALKVMSREDMMQKGLMPKIEREISVMRSIDHVNICKCYETFEQDDLIFLVLEHCPGDDLLKRVLSGKMKNIGDVKHVFLQICHAVKYLHDMGIAHGDIKPENVLVDDHGLVKLTDFGYCHTSYEGTNDDKSGTLLYAAPELFIDGIFRPMRADMWSLGVTLFSMATGQFPFPDGDDAYTVRQILKGNLLFPREMNLDVKNLVKKLLVLDPTRRLTIDEVLAEPFFESVMQTVKRSRLSSMIEDEDDMDAIDENGEWNRMMVLVA